MQPKSTVSEDSRRLIRWQSARACKYTLPILLLAAPIARSESALVVRDPNASFLDVQARRKALQNVQTPRLAEVLASPKNCTSAPMPAPPPPGQDIPSRYKSGSHGELNPQEHILSEPYYKVEDVAAWGADRYLITGDPQEAACVIHALLPWAMSKALLDYNAKNDMTVWFQSTWAVASLSLSVSVIRAEPTLNSDERDLVIAWLRKAAHKAINETRGPNSGTERNNHFFWRGLAATAAGVISKDDDLYSFGLKTYATAIGEIDSNGAFPLEMERHELALHYQAFAIEPLVMIAELARHQGIDLYGLEKNKHCLSDAVSFLSRAMADPSLVKKYTPETQQTGSDLAPGSQLLAWIEFWNARFDDPSLKSLLQMPFFASRLGGNTTLYVAPVDETNRRASTNQIVK
jgi:poly(beta-D-mannuronate) lyase